MSTVFFIDSVLAHLSSCANGVLEYVVPSESHQALELLKGKGARMGLIVHIGKQPKESLERELKKANLLGFFAPDLTIFCDAFSESVLVEAASRARRQSGGTYFVAENCEERTLAIAVGFDKAVPHVSLVSEVLSKGTLVYVLVSKLNRRVNQEQFGRLLNMAVLPLYVTYEGLGLALVITTSRLLKK